MISVLVNAPRSALHHLFVSLIRFSSSTSSNFPTNNRDRVQFGLGNFLSILGLSLRFSIFLFRFTVHYRFVFMLHSKSQVVSVSVQTRHLRILISFCAGLRLNVECFLTEFLYEVNSEWKKNCASKNYSVLAINFLFLSLKIDSIKSNQKSDLIKSNKFHYQRISGCIEIIFIRIWQIF